MLYELVNFSDQIGVLNVFRYITFRTGAAIFTALLFVMLFGPGIIDLLRVKQGKGQPIRDDGPKGHLLKVGTPTMGGLMIIAGVTVSTLLWAHLGKRAHMICELSPYACMPNTMSIGAMAGVVGKHPDLLYAAIEVKGDAEVHALSRCQMILTEAKKRAIREYVEAMQRTGLTPETAQPLIEARPGMKRATYPLPHAGAAATAANALLHLAEVSGNAARPAPPLRRAA